MSLFSTKLRIILENNKINQVELAKRTGLTPSQIHNYLHENFRAITKEHLAAIIDQCSDHVGDRAELAKCYLLDVLPDNIKEFLDIIPMEKPKDFGNWYFETERLPAEFKQDFEALYKVCASSTKARDFSKEFVAGLVDTMGAGGNGTKAKEKKSNR